MKRSNAIVLILFALLSWFSYGTAMMDYFLVYPSRMIVGAGEFVAYHALLEDAILPVSVLPFFIITILNGILLWKRPAYVSGILLWISFIALLLDWASSIFIQIPMNIELNTGKNEVLIQQVMDTNWGRIFLESLQAIVVFFILLPPLTRNALHKGH